MNQSELEKECDRITGLWIKEKNRSNCYERSLNRLMEMCSQFDIALSREVVRECKRVLTNNKRDTGLEPVEEDK